MPQSQKTLNPSNPIVDGSGKMQQFFVEFMLSIRSNTPIVGTGSPEGNTPARQYSLYIDETVPTAPVQYRKMLTQVGGDIKKGWVVV